jgi:hypothetical protein
MTCWQTQGRPKRRGLVGFGEACTLARAATILGLAALVCHTGSCICTQPPPHPPPPPAPTHTHQKKYARLARYSCSSSTSPSVFLCSYAEVDLPRRRHLQAAFQTWAFQAALSHEVARSGSESRRLEALKEQCATLQSFLDPTYRRRRGKC